MARNKIKYSVTRFENNVDYIPPFIEGKYNIPFIKPEPYVEAQWLPFNYAGSTTYKREERGIHFFVYDYYFQSLWSMREKYKDMLPQFKAVMAPDFSLYVDWPVMVQMWNHYRKHLIGSWMQSIGCRVYPVIRWAGQETYEWCFDGEPYKGTVCVSSVGMTKDKNMLRMFIDGYQAMMDILKPETIIFNGHIPNECQGNIVQIEPFSKRFSEVKKKNDKT